MQARSRTYVKNKNCQRGDCCSAPAKTPFLFADFVAYQAEQLRQQESSRQQSQNPRIEIGQQRPSSPPGTKWPEKLDADSADEVQQDVARRTDDTNEQRQAERKLRSRRVW